MTASKAALVVLGLYAAGAHAADPDASMFSFSGFATVGVVHSSEDQADFTGSPSKPRGAGHSHAWSSEVDSLIAAQVSFHPTPRLSAVLQVISEQNPDHTYRPHVEWASVRYQFTPEFGIRVGRIVLPILMVTDSRKVGYANPWVRPPVEVYSMVPVSNSDGVDATYRASVGAATNTLQVAAGRSDPRFPTAASGTTTAKVREIVTLADAYEHGFASMRLNYGRARITLPATGVLFDAFRQFGPEGAALADRYDAKDTLVTFVGAGASFDPGPWFVMGEWTRIQSDSMLGTKSSWYVGGGARFGKLMPYATYARANADNLSDPGLTLSALPAPLVGPAMGLNAGLNSILMAKAVQSTVSVGARWDVSRNAALKLQFDHTRIGAGSTGVLGNIQPGFQLGGKLNVFSATMDFVFR